MVENQKIQNTSLLFFKRKSQIFLNQSENFFFEYKNIWKHKKTFFFVFHIVTTNHLRLISKIGPVFENTLLFLRFDRLRKINNHKLNTKRFPTYTNNNSIDSWGGKKSAVFGVFRKFLLSLWTELTVLSTFGTETKDMIRRFQLFRK